MIKRIFLSITVFAIAFSLFGCGGGGTGSSSEPPGTNTGIPSVVTLLPSNFVAPTNSSITLSARVLDGNGTALANIPVGFSKVSGTGVLSALFAVTNSNGVASVVIASSAPGFSSVQSEVATGSGLLRDTKTVFFSSEASLSDLPTMTLDVDGVGTDGKYNGIYNEQTSDFTLFQHENDTQVLIRAKLSSLLDLEGDTVTFTSDTTNKAVTFPDGTNEKYVATIGADNKASVQVTFNNPSLIESVINISAAASNGAFNMVSLFLAPVTVSSVVVTSDKAEVASEGTAKITAFAASNLNKPVPDGTTVNFTSTPTVTFNPPFAQTAGGTGKVETTMTAPIVTADTKVTVTATAGGKSDSTQVTVKPTLAPRIDPASYSISNATGGTAVFTITGGSAPYTITSSDATKAFNSTPGNGVWTNIAAGSSITVTVPKGAVQGNVTLTATDSLGKTGTATISINASSALVISPNSVSITRFVGGTPSFTITGGVGPYKINSSDSAKAYDSAPGDGIWEDIPEGSSITVTVPFDATVGQVTLTVTDFVGTTKTATISIQSSSIPLAVTPSLDSIPGSSGGKRLYTVSGGTPPYSAFSFCDVSVLCNSVDDDCVDFLDDFNWVPSPTFEVTVPSGTAQQSCAIEVSDAAAQSVGLTIDIN